MTWVGNDNVLSPVMLEQEAEHEYETGVINQYLFDAAEGVQLQ